MAKPTLTILMIFNHNDGISGEIIYINDVANGLIQRGHRVVTFAIDTESADVAQRTRWRKMRWMFSQSIFNLRIYRSVRSQVRQVRPDIVHLHNVDSVPSVLLACRGMKMIQTIHELSMIHPFYELLSVSGSSRVATWRDLWYHMYRGNLRPMRVLFDYGIFNHTWWKRRFISKFICPSSVGVQLCRRHGLSPSVHLPHYAMLPPAQYHDLQKYGDSNVVLFVGRFAVIKGLEYLLRAFALVRKAEPQLILKIVGTGRGRERLERMAEALGLNGSVNFLGRVGQPELLALYHEASMVVIPSIVNEMGPLVVLEAMACARPTVAFNIGGQGELITAAHAGILVKPFDVDGFAQAILDLHGDKDQAHRLGSNGLKYVMHHATKEQHLSALLEQYNEVINTYSIMNTKASHG